MGIDYTPVFGIGVEIAPEFIEELDANSSTYESVVYDYFQSIVEDTEFRFANTGDYISGDGDDFRFFLILRDTGNIDDPSFVSKIAALKEFISRHGIRYIGDITVVGGLRIN